MVTLILEKRTYLLNLLQLFKERNEVSAKEVRKKLSDSSYYRQLLPKLVEINNALKTCKTGYFVKPVFVKQGKRVFSGLRMNPKAKIKVKDNFISLNYENPQTNHPPH